MSVIFASTLTNFIDYDKLVKNEYNCNFAFNLVKNNDVKLT